MKAHEAKEVARADSLLDQIKRLQSDALRILGKAEEDADWKASVSAIREARGCLETLARLTDKLKDEKPVVNNITFYIPENGRETK